MSINILLTSLKDSSFAFKENPCKINFDSMVLIFLEVINDLSIQKIAFLKIAHQLKFVLPQGKKTVLSNLKKHFINIDREVDKDWQGFSKLFNEIINDTDIKIDIVKSCHNLGIAKEDYKKIVSLCDLVDCYYFINDEIEEVSIKAVTVAFLFVLHEDLDFICQWLNWRKNGGLIGIITNNQKITIDNINTLSLENFAAYILCQYFSVGIDLEDIARLPLLPNKLTLIKSIFRWERSRIKKDNNLIEFKNGNSYGN